MDFTRWRPRPGLEARIQDLLRRWLCRRVPGPAPGPSLPRPASLCIKSSQHFAGYRPRGGQPVAGMNMLDAGRVVGWGLCRPPGPPTSPSPAGPANPGSWQWAAWASTGPAMGPRGLQPLSRSRREPNCPFLGHWWEVSHQPTKCRRRLTRLQRGWAKKEKDQCRPATTSQRSTGLCGDEPPPTPALTPLRGAPVTG